MSLVREFEELRIWSESRQQVVEIYSLFSECRDFSFRDQIQRAAVSVMNNIAEGYERSSNKDFAHFLIIAKSSCGEVRSMLYLAEDLGYVRKEQSIARRLKAKQLSRSIYNFRSKLV